MYKRNFACGEAYAQITPSQLKEWTSPNFAALPIPNHPAAQKAWQEAERFLAYGDWYAAMLVLTSLIQPFSYERNGCTHFIKATIPPQSDSYTAVKAAADFCLHYQENMVLWLLAICYQVEEDAQLIQQAA